MFLIRCSKCTTHPLFLSLSLTHKCLSPIFNTHVHIYSNTPPNNNRKKLIFQKVIALHRTNDCLQLHALLPTLDRKIQFLMVKFFFFSAYQMTWQYGVILTSYLNSSCPLPIGQAWQMNKENTKWINSPAHSFHLALASQWALLQFFIWMKETHSKEDGCQWHKRAIWKGWRHKSKGSKSAVVFRRPRRRNHSWQCRWSNSELRCYILDGTWLRRVWNLIPRWITSCIGSTLYPRGVRGEKRPAHGSFKRQ